CSQARTIFFNSTFGYISIPGGHDHYLSNQRCEWLIISPDPVNFPFVSLRILSRDTECGYDFVSVYDGASQNDKVLAKLSGDSSTTRIDTLYARSARMLIYFYSDRNYVRQGFTAEFSILSCLNNCSGNGDCLHNKCSCYPGWFGESCDQLECSNRCGGSLQGFCNFTSSKCMCNVGYIGKDCSMATRTSSNAGGWNVVDRSGDNVAFHTAAYAHPYLYTFGGYDLNIMKNTLHRYDFQQNSWEKMIAGSISPSARAFHTIVYILPALFTWFHKILKVLLTLVHLLQMEHIVDDGLDYLIVFGGDLGDNQYLNDLWLYNISGNTWLRQNNLSSPPPVSRHASCVLQHSHHLYIFGGMVHGEGGLDFSSELYKFDWKSWAWSKVNSSGLKPSSKKVAGHSMVYDSVDNLFIVFGGFHASKPIAVRSKKLLLFKIDQSYWYEVELKGSTPMAFHSANIIGDYMVVHGGSVHQHTSDESCYSDTTYLYNMRCGKWSSVHTNYSGMYGHVSSILPQNILLVHGGYDGTVLNALHAFKPPLYVLPNLLVSNVCTNYDKEDQCLLDQRCVWCSQFSFCSENTAQCSEDQLTYPVCDGICKHLNTCTSCSLFNRYQFVGGSWVPEKCGWCVADQKCTGLNSTSGSCNQLDKEISWIRDYDSPIISPPSCLVRKLVKGFFVQYYKDNQLNPYQIGTIANKPGLNINIETLKKHCDYHILKRFTIILQLQVVISNGQLSLITTSDESNRTLHYIQMIFFCPTLAKCVVCKNATKYLESHVKYCTIYAHHFGWHPLLSPMKIAYIWSWWLQLFTLIESKYLEAYNTEGGSCAGYSSCLLCLSDTSCMWCTDGNACVAASPSACHNAGGTGQVVTDPHLCPVCSDSITCWECSKHRYCRWTSTRGCLQNSQGGNKLKSVCSTSCSERKSCRTCLEEEGGGGGCSWCESSRTCYSFQHHFPIYLLGQCGEWMEDAHQCRNCSTHNACASCIDEYHCGWCFNTGNSLNGKCMDGEISDDRCGDPYLPSQSWSYASCPDVDECNAGSLHSCHENATCSNTPHSYRCSCNRGFHGDGFSCSPTCYNHCGNGYCSESLRCECDLGWRSSPDGGLYDCSDDCLCNFHSSCNTSVGICDECQHNTHGSHCELCVAGSYGNASSPHGCQTCQCNNHGELANICNQSTGECVCTDHTTGRNCQLCANGYYGNASNGGMCYQECDGRYLVESSLVGGFGTRYNFNKIKHCFHVIKARSASDIVVLEIENNLDIDCQVTRLYVYNGIPGVSAPLGAVCGSNSAVFYSLSGDLLTANSLRPCCSTGFTAQYQVVSCTNHPSITDCLSTNMSLLHCSSEEQLMCFNVCIYVHFRRFKRDPLLLTPQGMCVCTHPLWGQLCGLQSGIDSNNSVPRSNIRPTSIIGHSMVIYNQSLLVYGGFRFNNSDPTIYRFNTTSRMWDFILPSMFPDTPYFHSSVALPGMNSMLVLGGILHNGSYSNRLWKLMLAENFSHEWIEILSNATLPAVAGHTITLCSKHVILLGGYTHSGIINKQVWSFDIYTHTCKEVKTKGEIVGMFGHTAVCDKTTHRIFVFGGLHFESSQSANLFVYHTRYKRWSKLVSSPQPLNMMFPAISLFHTGNQFLRIILYFTIRLTVAYLIPSIHELFFHQCSNGIFYFISISRNSSWSAVIRPLNKEDSDIYLYRGGTKLLFCKETKILFSDHFNIYNTIKFYFSQTIKVVSKCFQPSLKCRGGINILCTGIQIIVGWNTSVKPHLLSRSCKECNLNFPYNNFFCGWDGRTCVSGNFTTPSENCVIMYELHLVCTVPAQECSECAHLDCSSCVQSSQCIWLPQGGCENIESIGPAPTNSDLLICRKSCNEHKSCDTCLSQNSDCSWSTRLRRCLSVGENILYCSTGVCGRVIKHVHECPVVCAHSTYCHSCLMMDGCGWYGTDDGSGCGDCRSGSYQNPTDHSTPTCPQSHWWFVQCPPENECVNGHNTCQQFETCADTLDYFQCSCVDGYFRNGVNLQCVPRCQPECLHGVCTSPNVCSCSFGFTGDTCNISCPCNNHSDCNHAFYRYYLLLIPRCTGCLHHTSGEYCNHCEVGFVGDPSRNNSCLPCNQICNGRSDTCISKSIGVNLWREPLYGVSSVNDAVCIGCSGNSFGDHCQDCYDGYFMVGNLQLLVCRRCECNGHGNRCNKLTGNSCQCWNRTTTSCGVEAQCWRQQCNLCMDGFKGNPVNGGHCYRLVNVNQEWCFDPTLQGGCVDYGFDRELELSVGYSLLFALLPRFVNVDMRLILDVTHGAVDVFISDLQDAFVVTINQLLTTNPQKAEVIDYLFYCCPTQCINIISYLQLLLWISKYVKSFRLIFKCLDNLFQSFKCDPVIISFLEHQVNATNLNNFITIAPNFVLHIKQLQNRLIVTFPRTYYNFQKATFYIIVKIYMDNMEITLQYFILQDQTRIDLFVFFSVFFSCFFLFLSICIVAWKLKHHVDARRNILAHHIQLQHMASRPFAYVYLL
uniref:Multiple EGF-like-domains 8 n=1 Tax=Ciona savignyi TaxID=51511 RepID=H2YIS7_CIOSA